MESHKFRYVSVLHSEIGAGFVGIDLERGEGIHLVAVLSVNDAKRLLDDLPQQIQTASKTTT